MITEPMLAATLKRLDDPKLKFPLIATPKLNGWRCLKVGGKVLTRKFKPLPNHHIRETLEKILPDGIDGEILCGTYNETQKACARREGEPEFEFHAFDFVPEKGRNTNCLYKNRLRLLTDWYERGYCSKSGFVKLVPRELIAVSAQLVDCEEHWVGKEGYEGICLRTPDSPYKCGRSTLREQYLMKYKRFEDSEFEILDFIELKHNENADEKDTFGRTKRSKAKAGMAAGNTLGALLVRDIHNGLEFEIGTGWTAEERQEIWDNQKKYRKIIGKYKYNKHGMKDRPLNASWQGWRSKVDM